MTIVAGLSAIERRYDATITERAVIPRLQRVYSNASMFAAPPRTLAALPTLLSRHLAKMIFSPDFRPTNEDARDGLFGRERAAGLLRE